MIKKAANTAENELSPKGSIRATYSFINGHTALRESTMKRVSSPSSATNTLMTNQTELLLVTLLMMLPFCAASWGAQFRDLYAQRFLQS
jgi:hypothetical protein